VNAIDHRLPDVSRDGILSDLACQPIAVTFVEGSNANRPDRTGILNWLHEKCVIEYAYVWLSSCLPKLLAHIAGAVASMPI
jgi:hypothetical protein